MLASIFALSSLALAEPEATRPVVLWDELNSKPTVIQLVRGGNDRVDPFAELKKKRAAERAKQRAKEQSEENPKPAQAPAKAAGES